MMQSHPHIHIASQHLFSGAEMSHDKLVSPGKAEPGTDFDEKREARDKVNLRVPG